MKRKRLIYGFILLLSAAIIAVDKFVLTGPYGWGELLVFALCLAAMLYSMIRLCQLSRLSRPLRILLEIVLILIILWLSLLSIDYKRHRNLFPPLFNGIGFEAVQDYDMDIRTGRVYQSSSTFYIFGIEVNKTYAAEK
ncbi:MAG TPA: hypothetical protein IAB39_00720 [Candidatus Onthovicinus excrementipullorum]|nr:hypothetical protein [Candidatus Onthovicinus excrementipullorum]